MITFVGNQSEGFYISNGSKSRWQNCPSELATHLRSVNTSQVRGLAGGPGGKYWLRTSQGTYTNGTASGIPTSDIRIYAFGGKGDWFSKSSAGGTKWGSVDQTLRDKIDEVGSRNIKTLSIGTNGSWAMTWGNNRWSWHGCPSRLGDKLRAASSVENIVLSPFNSDHWWVEYGNGNSDFWLPKSWKDDLDHVRH
ncbi:uncharacterized protein FIBRA_04808 [Fibroporia radiculosa]|uniref:Uncharacterized protein n=1 Tax=Fibroporia radiculosa TaxID=599839 RepID=J4HWR1_9APHY|nr:uncharacterized protein FIBRA_04808 [Fibroporia radiculosa]CCM02702.1 predicted protein [Fibroporia radiculosa]